MQAHKHSHTPKQNGMWFNFGNLSSLMNDLQLLPIYVCM